MKSGRNQESLRLSGHLELDNLVCCEECDALYHYVALKNGERAYCQQCNAELYQHVKSFNRLLALVITALIVFIIANSFPIVTIELQGRVSQTTLLGAAQAMFQTDKFLVGVIILITTFIVPLLNLVIFVYILTFIHFFKSYNTLLIYAFRILHIFRVWGMIEVFVIGILVTLVKLSGMVMVLPGIALWAFGILSVLLVYISSISIHNLWDELDRRLLCRN
ncbi:MAG: paraquat-inducible protein A [Acinetobacter sp.]